MFFVASKLLGFILTPSNLIALLGITGLAMTATRLVRLGRRLMGAAVVLLLLCGLSPLGDFLLLTLSERYPPWQQGSGSPPTGIVVLGGGISPEVSAARATAELNAAAERMTAAVELARRYPDARIVFSGGNASLVDTPDTEAAATRQLWEAMGIAPDRIILEDRSRTTAENAEFTKAMVQPKSGERWLLVTSAFHMPRSMAVFARYGFAVEAYPVDWRTRGWADAYTFFATVSKGLTRTDAAIHEWLGLIAYRLSGRTHQWVPDAAAR